MPLTRLSPAHFRVEPRPQLSPMSPTWLCEKQSGSCFQCNFGHEIERVPVKFGDVRVPFAVRFHEKVALFFLVSHVGRGFDIYLWCCKTLTSYRVNLQIQMVKQTRPWALKNSCNHSEGTKDKVTPLTNLPFTIVQTVDTHSHKCIVVTSDVTQ